MSDQVIDINLLVHIPIDDPRHIGTSSCTAKRRTSPRSTCDQLKRSGRNFLTGAGYSNDTTLAPALVGTFQCLTHGMDIADTLKTVVHSAAGHFDQGGRDILVLLRINEVSHAKLGCQGDF